MKIKRLISEVLSVVLSFTLLVTVSAKELKFTDVPTDAWYYADVKNAVSMGLINGKTETTYCPDDNLTYAEAIKLAACMNQLYTSGEISLKNGNPWYQSYVDYCIDKEIIDKEYSYNDYATRAGYMGIFAKALPDDALKAMNNVPDNSIPDVPSTRSYAAGVYKLYRAGILQGIDAEHNCNPLANIKRSEVATILSRMMDNTKRVKFSMGDEEQIPEETKHENPETENAVNGESSAGNKNKFEQTEGTEYKSEDFSMTIESWNVIKDKGIVIVGSITQGKINVGDTVYINNADGKYIGTTKVVGIEMFKKSIDEAKKGDNVGLVSDLDVDTWKGKLAKGYVVSSTTDASTSADDSSTEESTSTRPATATTRPSTSTNESSDGESSMEESTSTSTRPATPTARPSTSTNESSDGESSTEESTSTSTRPATPTTRPSTSSTRPTTTTPTGDNPLTITEVSGKTAIRSGTLVAYVNVKGGKAPYMYKWQYQYGDTWRGFYEDPKSQQEMGYSAINAENDIVSITSLGASYFTIRCVIIDSEGTEVVTEPFVIMYTDYMDFT